MRNVEAVFAAKRELEVVARDAGNLARLEAEQLADAVVLVDDVVSGAELGEGLERAARGCGAAAGAAADDLRVREQGEPELAPDEAAARVSDCEQELRLVGQLVALVDQPGVDAAQQVLGAQRFALVREGDDGAQATADERRGARSRLRRGRGRRSRGAVPRTRTAGRPEAGPARPRSRGRRASAPPAPRPRGRRPAARRSPGPTGPADTRSVGTGLGAVVVGKSDVFEVEPALGRGVDRDLVDRMERALRERREGADALDLVAEELDAERLAAGCRIDVDDAPAEGELASLLRLVDALVAREGEAARTARRSPGRRPVERESAPGAFQAGAGPRRARLPRR